MFSIGDFARLGLVSVRMLRHYDAIGLLRPAHVDPATGYRFYEADQLPRLNRIIALKGLGFTLQQVQTILDERVSIEELHGMLRLRRAQLQTQVAGDQARLAGVEARLRAIESEGDMRTADVLVKRVPPVRVAELTVIVASMTAEDIGPAAQPLYPELTRRLTTAGLTPTGPAINYYEDAPTGDGAVIVHTTLPVAADPSEYDFAIVDLPEIESAATLIHRGPMEDVGTTLQALARWIDDNGHRTVGYAREVYLECPPEAPDRWVTELQVTITKP